MHSIGYKSALARRACRYSDAQPPRKTDGVLLESELPPHMRGKAGGRRSARRRTRITPAYAGNSGHKRRLQSDRWDHPRVCGEKRFGTWLKCASLGSPPHMRGKDEQKAGTRRQVGITPAYAGKSPPWRSCSQRRWDHPRVCGEKSVHPLASHVRMGSPPHMRGKAAHTGGRQRAAGITPAYAGKRQGSGPCARGR